MREPQGKNICCWAPVDTAYRSVCAPRYRSTWQLQHMCVCNLIIYSGKSRSNTQLKIKILHSKVKVLNYYQQNLLKVSKPKLKHYIFSLQVEKILQNYQIFETCCVTELSRAVTRNSSKIFTPQQQRYCMVPCWM